MKNYNNLLKYDIEDFEEDDSITYSFQKIKKKNSGIVKEKKKSKNFKRFKEEFLNNPY